MYNLFSAQLKITVQIIQIKSVCSLLHNLFSAQFKIEMFALQIFLSEIDNIINIFISRLTTSNWSILVRQYRVTRNKKLKLNCLTTLILGNEQH